MASVRLEHISQRFGGVSAIEDISFETPSGSFWVLVGPSGCGKSTLLRTIAGLEPVREGRLYIGGALVNDVAARRRDVAMVFQNYALYPHMSVAQNLGFGLRMRGVPLVQRQKRIQEMASILGLTHLLDRRPGQLSGGQQQRVALGRAIARRPQVFLLDEPLSNLDAQLRDDTRAELKHLHQTFGITTLYVTHDQVEAMTLGDRIVVLDQGRIQQIGAPQEVYAHPTNRMVAAFIGSPPMNLLKAQFTGDSFNLDGQRLPCPNGLSLSLGRDSSICLGIRPEHLRVASPEHAHLHARVIGVEPLGRETHIRAALSDLDTGQPQALTVTVSAQLPLSPDQKLNLVVDLDQLFGFDSDSGNRLFPELI